MFALLANAAGWAPAGELLVARDGGASMARLLSGAVLVTGGRPWAGDLRLPLATAEIYMPQSDTWHSARSMNGPREEATATLLSNGTVLVVGGRDVTNALASAEFYDPVSDTWTMVGNMHSSRFSHTATRLEDGRVLVAGGVDQVSYTSSAEIYDPITKVWMSAPNMAKARKYHSATLLPNGKVLIAGGDNSTKLGLADTELYDPVSNSWSGGASMITGRSSHSATALSTGKVLVVGGGNDIPPYTLNSAEIYDPLANSWTNTGSMRDERESHSATLLLDGTVLVAGGTGITHGSFATYWSTSELYTPSTGIWVDAGNMARPNLAPTASLLADGRVLLIGFIATPTAESYTPTAPSVVPVPALGEYELVALSLMVGASGLLLRRHRLIAGRKFV
jgi:hypothetical protein